MRDFLIKLLGGYTREEHDDIVFYRIRAKKSYYEWRLEMLEEYLTKKYTQPRDERGRFIKKESE